MAWEWLAPTGVAASAVVSFFGARLGSRDARKNQTRLLEWQERQAAEKRQTDRQQRVAVSIESMMGALHSVVEFRTDIINKQTLADYAEDTKKKSNDLTEGFKLFAIYAPWDLYETAQRVATEAQQAAYRIVQHLGTAVAAWPDGLREMIVVQDRGNTEPGFLSLAAYREAIKIDQQFNQARRTLLVGLRTYVVGMPTDPDTT